MGAKKLQLKDLRFSETVGTQTTLEIRKISFETFNLVIGDNAQGKTRELSTNCSYSKSRLYLDLI